MWGANKWTDAMFKKHWKVILFLVAIFLFVKFLT
jgi:hypothetical protein